MKQPALFLMNWLWIVAAPASMIRDADAPPLARQETNGRLLTPACNGYNASPVAEHAGGRTRKPHDLKEPPPVDRQDAGESLQDEYYEAAIRRDGKDAATALGEKILKKQADAPAKLNEFAWTILTDDSLLHHDDPLALRAAQRAYDLSQGKDHAITDTYARALFKAGRVNDAIAMQHKAVDLCGTPKAKLELMETLADYEHPAAAGLQTDEQRVDRFLTEVLAMIKAGKVVPVDELLAKTDVKPHAVKLAKPSSQPVSSEELYDRARQSVLMIGTVKKNEDLADWDVALATGFIIHESGIFVTNFHVLDHAGAAAMAAMTADGKVHPVKSVLAVAPFPDIAICQLDGVSGMAPLPLVPAAKPGSHVRVLSHPDNAFYSLSEGIISRYSTYRADGKSTTVLTTTAEFASGSSGGPLIDNCGNVTGMVASSMTVYSGPEESTGDPATKDADGMIDDKGDVQMVLKMCVPSAEILKLVGSAGSN